MRLYDLHKCDDVQKIIDTLKSQEAALKCPEKTKNLTLAPQSTCTTHTVGEYWKDLYTNPELFAKLVDAVLY